MNRRALIGVVAAVASIALIEFDERVIPAASNDNPCSKARDVEGCWKDRVFSADDPCRIIRTTEAEKIIGYELGHPGRFSKTMCYNLVKFPADEAEFQYELRSDPKAVEAFRVATRKLTDSIAGLGDQARWDPKNSRLHVLDGPSYVWVWLAELPERRAMAIRLARIALQRAAA